MVVASNDHKFYKLAINLIHSIKDFDPEAKVCFATEKLFCDGQESIADHMIYCSDWIREKLTVLSETPFDITMYIDADCEVRHEDISKAFDMLDGHDLMFTPLTEDRIRYFKPSSWKNDRLKINGGVFVYDIRNPIVKDFMVDWAKYYKLQKLRLWWPEIKNDKPDYTNIPQHLEEWDQFTLWWLLEKNKKYKNIKLKYFDEEIRWNFYSVYNKSENYTNKEIVIYHYQN